MGKSEVQSLVAFILSCFQVVVFLFGAQLVPDLFTGFVSPDIIAFNEDSHHSIPRNEGEKNFVTSSVVGLIICSIDLFKHQCFVRQQSIFETVQY